MISVHLRLPCGCAKKAIEHTTAQGLRGVDVADDDRRQRVNTMATGTQQTYRAVYRVVEGSVKYSNRVLVRAAVRTLFTLPVAKA